MGGGAPVHYKPEIIILAPDLHYRLDNNNGSLATSVSVHYHFFNLVSENRTSSEKVFCS